MKSIDKTAKRIVYFASAVCLLGGGFMMYDSFRREYATPLETFYKGADQKIFVDRKPFGSLDGVRVNAFTDCGSAYHVAERKSYLGEEVAFKTLEEIGKRECPARFIEGN